MLLTVLQKYVGLHVGMPKAHGSMWKPSKDDYAQVLRDQNPWWETGTVPEVFARRTARPLGAHLWQRLDSDHPRRYQLVLGPRRVGKSTCLYQTVRQLIDHGVPPRRISWFRLDHPLLMALPLGDVLKMAIRRGQRTFVVLDELAYGRDWDLWLKTAYDEQWPIHLAASSSAAAVIRGRRLESGVGRWEEQYLAPYLLPEYLSLIDRAAEIPVADTLADTLRACTDADIDTMGLPDARQRYMLIGGFPELIVDVARNLDDESALLQSQQILRSDAIERIIYKDIPQAFGIDNPMMLERLLYILAGQITGILSPTHICRSLRGITQPTFDRYLAYLERSFLIFTLPNYSGAEESRQRRGRKLYFVDSAVRNAALQRGLGPLRDHTEMGLLTENLVAGHLHALSLRSGVRLYHWRHGRDEVDLIYDYPSAPLAFEIAMSQRHSRAGLHALVRQFPRFEGRCYLATPNSVAQHPDQTADGVGTLPLDLLLLAIGSQAERRLRDALSIGRQEPFPS